ncbi:MAG: glycosyltransferase family 9 protein [Collimonas sp.]|uniref:glycosyltransferase family 9 protein n=1 Tax=Collimonas sp. TaxID=1963772 RepID=UPI003263FB15
MTDLNDLIISFSAYQRQKNPGTALDLIRKLTVARKVEDAIDLAGKWGSRTELPSACVQLALQMNNLGMYEPAEILLTQALSDLPSDFDRYICKSELSLAQYAQGKFDFAYPHFAEIRQPAWCDTWLRLGSATLDSSWFAPFKDKVLGNHAIDGKRIMVSGEGGVGDIFQLARYIKYLKAEGASTIYWHLPESLHRMFAHSSLPVTFVSGIVVPADAWDYITWPFTLLARYQKSPYFPNEPPGYLGLRSSEPLSDSLLGKLRCRSGDRRRIGLAWRSASGARQEPFRSMKLKDLVPLLESSDADFYSLQVDGIREDEQEIMDRYRIVDLGAHLYSFGDTANILDQLDLLISIDSAPIHLAGALNRPVWAMLSKSADARWYNCQRYTPWYPSMRLFRQNHLGDWGPVIHEMIAAGI